MYSRIIAILFFLVTCGSAGMSQTPVFEWTFDGAEPLKDKVAGLTINTQTYPCTYTTVKGAVGNGISFSGTQCIAQINVLKKVTPGSFSLAFFFKGHGFNFISFPSQLLSFNLTYPSIAFGSAYKNGTQVVSDYFSAKLTGAGSNSYDVLSDGNWHHVVFVFDKEKGRKQIWLDGTLSDQMQKNIKPGEQIFVDALDGFKGDATIDELAAFNKAIGQAEISSMIRKKGVSFAGKENSGKEAVVSKTGTDPLEFAPGYPQYTVQAIDQLKRFPGSRYTNEERVNRNVNWTDISYLHRELPEGQSGGFGKADPVKAIAITDELVNRWHYYIDIPVLRKDTLKAADEYRNQSTLAGALVQYARRNPSLPYAAILFQAQSDPGNAGFRNGRPFTVSQDLPDEYYLKDKSGKPIVYGGKKWLSPNAPLDYAMKDGITSGIYLKQLIAAAQRPPGIISENGEIFGHNRKEALLKQDPRVWKHFLSTGYSLEQYNGWFQNNIDSSYKMMVLKYAGLKPGINYSLFNLSAMNASYWPDYKMRRKLNQFSNKQIYSTPDFYPSSPENWLNANGALNGFTQLARGRLIEIQAGDLSFSPFVSAGWGKEELNIRPAQWLALLKSMVMLGADFFYTGYFNITGAGGKWPNGTGPYDPRGYIYQLAMPAYAQAVRSRIPEFFEKGTLLNPANPKGTGAPFRFAGSNQSDLILVRKLGQKYLIYGSIQPNSNIKGNVPQTRNTEIVLDGRKIIFEIRRQGSMYILNLENKTPVFYQLDGWHQYEHPYYWNKDFTQEAEVFAKIEGRSWSYKTDNSGGEFNFTKNATVLEMKSGVKVVYDGISLSAGNYRIRFTFNNISSTGGGRMNVKLGNVSREVRLNGNEKTFVLEKILLANELSNGELQLDIKEGNISLDCFTIEKIN